MRPYRARQAKVGGLRLLVTFSVFRGDRLFAAVTRLGLPKKMAPEVGFEPTTNRLTADRSTTELLRSVVGQDTNRDLGRFKRKLHRFTVEQVSKAGALRLLQTIPGGNPSPDVSRPTSL